MFLKQTKDLDDLYDDVGNKPLVCFYKNLNWLRYVTFHQYTRTSTIITLVSNLVIH